MDFLLDRIITEIGTLLIVSDGERLCALDYGGYEERMGTLLHRRYGCIQFREAPDPQGFSSRIRSYLTGHYKAINDIPVNTGGTPFQRQVWAALRTIPVGTTLSYGDMAMRLGKPAVYRAVGMANALNPIAIVIPCHRMIGSNGALTGYAGGLERKRWLLAHEKAAIVDQEPRR
jgi:methylated-DNA-[protein]-cysteine S-methyltransferase